MTPESSYNLVFKGDLATGADPLTVRKNLSRLLKRNLAAVEPLFGGRITVLKRNLSRAEAEKFKRVFDATGALSLLEPVPADLTAATVTPADPPPAMPVQAATASRAAAPAEKPAAIVASPIPGAQPGAVPGTRGYGIFLSVLILAGVCFLGFGGYQAVRTILFLDSAANVTGTVTGYAASRGSGSSRSTTYAPEVRFRAPDNRLIRFRSQLASTVMSYRQGDRVAVKFDPADPHRAEIDAFMPLWGLTLILVVLGSVTGAAGARMLRRHRRAMLFSGASWSSGPQNGLISCPNCWFPQPETDLCRVCRADIGRLRERADKAARLGTALAARATTIRAVAVVISLSIAIVGITSTFRHWQSATADYSLRSEPTIWADPDHRYEFSIPVDWQPQSTRDVVTAFPLLGGEPPTMYQLVATPNGSPGTVFALGMVGMAGERRATAGWENELADVGSGNRVVFTDQVAFNGLTLQRVGFETPLGYRENTFFEAAGSIIMVCFAVRNGPDLPEQVTRMREAVRQNLTGT